MPALILLVVLLTGFGLIGLTIQATTHNMLGIYLPAAIAVIPALLLSLPIVRVFGGFLGKIMPKDETDAVSVDTLIGRIATITIGEAKKGRPAEARTKDIHGTTHYLMVEPDSEELSFKAGEQVLLVQRQGAVFTVIANPNPHLVDQ